jgi:UDP-GlcNAc:undecaprenyl-phosphate GlcNAc-1-phosphate transferase
MITQISSTAFMFEAILLAAILAIVTSLLAIRLAWRINLVDLPGAAPHKQHTRPTPLAGGIVLFATLFIGSWLTGLLQDATIRSIFIASAIVFAFGLWDDFMRIRPMTKLIGQILASIVLIFLGVSVQILESPEFFIRGSGGLYVALDWLITIFWLVGISNAFNFVDSMDGLAVGLGATSAAFFMLVTLDASQVELTRLSALIIGGCIGLYLFNAPTALLFLGDSGAQLLGFVLGALAIAYQPQNANQASSWLVPILLLAVPIFDAALVIISRIRRKKSIYVGAQDHTFHRLANLGLGPFRSVLVMQIAALLLGCLAVIVLSQPPLIANFIFVLVLAFGAVVLVYLERHNPI